jgi:hypothetical protein
MIPGRLVVMRCTEEGGSEHAPIDLSSPDRIGGDDLPDIEDWTRECGGVARMKVGKCVARPATAGRLRKLYEPYLRMLCAQ